MTASIHPLGAALRPLRLQRFSAAEASRANQVASLGVAGLQLGGLAVTVTPLPAAPASALLAAAGAAWCVTLLADGAPAVLHLPDDLIRTWLQAAEPALELDPMPAPALLALLAALVLRRHLAAGKVMVQGVAPGAWPGGDALHASAAAGQRTWPVALSADSAVMGCIMAAWPRRRRALALLRLPARLRLGTTDLPAGLVRSLRPGDAVVLQASEGRVLTLVVAEHWAAGLVRDGTTLRLSQAPQGLRATGRNDWRMIGDMAGMGDQDGVPHPADDADAIPVRLAFDVGHLDLPLGEVRALGPGSVLPVGTEADGPVTIRANGQRVGTGELVQVEGALAVRVTRLFGLD